RQNANAYRPELAQIRVNQLQLADLAAQMDTISRQLEEERQLRQLAEVEICEVRAAAAPQTLPPTPAPVSPHHLISRLPEQFDGTRFPTPDRSKIIFVLGNVTSVMALTLEEFSASFSGYFLDPERKSKAKRALQTQQFNLQAYKSGWDNTVLISLYRGLKENIRFGIVLSGRTFAKLPNIQTLCEIP
ncbi:hypothetical protein VP01_9892g1, partial [Puccinia sorghi]